MARRKKLASNLLSSIIYIVVGVLFCIYDNAILDTLLTVAGIVFIVLGVVDLIKENFVSGLSSVVVGAVILVGAWFFLEVVFLVMGILLIVKGALALLGAIKNGSLLGFIFAGLTAAAGVMLVISKTDQIMNWLFIAVGVVLIIDGVLGLLECLTGKR